MPWGLWLPGCYVTPSLTWMGRHLILPALDYIIQLQSKDFHVYLRENLLFKKGCFSAWLSCSAAACSIWDLMSRTLWKSPVVTFFFLQKAAVRRRRLEKCISATLREKTFSSPFPWFYLFFLFCFSVLRSDSDTVLSAQEADEGWKSANRTTDCKSAARETAEGAVSTKNGYAFP